MSRITRRSYTDEFKHQAVEWTGQPFVDIRLP